jgi:perosamine synthetase
MCLTDDDALAEQLRELRNHGQSGPGRFGRASGNHRMSELAAAVGVVQMGRLAGIVERRAALAARYEQGFASLPLALQQSAPGTRANRQTLGVVLSAAHGAGERDRVIAELGQRGVQAGLLSHAVHRLPHMARYAEAAQRQGRSLETSARIVANGLALPLYPSMSPEQQQQVIDAVHAVVR